MGLPRSGGPSFRGSLDETSYQIGKAIGVISQEELRLDLVKGTTNNSSRGPKDEKEEEENVALATKGKVKKGFVATEIV